jgi:hypothetical protein
MFAEFPEVARLRNRLTGLTEIENLIFVLLLARFTEDQVDLGNFEAGDGNVEVQVDG